MREFISRQIAPGDDITARFLNETSAPIQGSNPQAVPPGFLYATVEVTGALQTSPDGNYHECTREGAPDGEVTRVYLQEGSIQNVGSEAIALYSRRRRRFEFLSTASPVSTPWVDSGCVIQEGTLSSVEPIFNGHKFCENYVFGPVSNSWLNDLSFASLPDNSMVHLFYDGTSGPGGTNQWVSDGIDIIGESCSFTIWFYMVEEADGLWVYADTLGAPTGCAYDIVWAFRSAFPDTPYIDRNESFRLNLSRTAYGYGYVFPPIQCAFFLIPATPISWQACGSSFVPTGLSADTTASLTFALSLQDLRYCTLSCTNWPGSSAAPEVRLLSSTFDSQYFRLTTPDGSSWVSAEMTLTELVAVYNTGSIELTGSAVTIDGVSFGATVTLTFDLA